MKNKNILIFSAKILATILLFYYVNKNLDFSQVSKMGNLGLVFFIAITFAFLQQFFLFLRWYFSLKTLNVSESKKSVLKSYLIGQFLGTVTPARSGDLAKVFYLENTNKKQGTYAVILDGAVAILTLLIISYVIFILNVSSFLSKSLDYFDESMLNIVGIFLNVIAVIPIVAIIVILTLSKTELSATFWRNFAKLFGVSLLQYTILLMQSALIFSVILPFSVWDAFASSAYAYFIMLFIPVIASIGAREYAFTFAFSAQSYEATIFAASYILLLCNSVIFMLPGIYLFYRTKSPQSP